MTTLGSNYLTLADWARRQDPDGKTAMVVDLLSQTNEWLADMPWVECNETTSYKTTVRTGLPSATWRQLYQGVQPTKSTTAQVVEGTGMLETYSVIDKALADLNGNTAQFRLQEDAAFIEGVNQQFSSALAYSNSLATPAQIMGFTPRYNTLSTATPVSANVINAGGTGSDNTSIWFIGWGPTTIHGIFPKGSMAGLQHRDLGEWTQTNSDGSKYQVYQSNFRWDTGLCVRDWRYAVRICNIDISDLNTTNTANLAKLLVVAANKFPTVPRNLGAVQDATKPSGTVGMGANFAIYCNRTVRTALETQLLDKPGGGNTSIFLRMEEWGGMPVLSFRGVPIRTVDSLLENETVVS